LIVAQVAGMSQHDQLAVTLRQTLHDRVDLCSPFASLAVLFRCRKRTFELELIRAFLVFGFNTLGRSGIFSDVVDRGIMRDAVEPCGEFVFGAVTARSEERRVGKEWWIKCERDGGPRVV